MQRILRTVLLLFLVMAGTVTLVRVAPGYFSDVTEMDAIYGQTARDRVAMLQKREGSVLQTIVQVPLQILRGDLGESRQFQIPVSTLIRMRLAATGWLLLRGVGCGWLLAFACALPMSAARGRLRLVDLPFTLLLAVPAGAMATLCLRTEYGGPALVLTLLVAARDYKFLLHAMRATWHAPHLLQARAQGFSPTRLMAAHLLPTVLPSLRALATMSLVTALSALVPLEVLFDLPGVGQLAWMAAMNRDLPVLLAVTLLMAMAVAGTGALWSSQPTGEFS